MPPLTQSVSDLFWTRLVSLVRERRVIPVVGSDLTAIAQDGRALSLDEWIIQRLPDDLVQPEMRHAPGVTLNDVAYGLLRARRQREFEDLYLLVAQILRDEPPPVSPALLALASIREFSLFVSTTYDHQLQRALDQGRFQGEPRTHVMRYELRGEDDIPAIPGAADPPIVYHLLGYATEIPGECALTEEDTLEFLHALQSEQRRPRNLFRQMHKSTLLILGSGFPDWLARFFLRVTHPDRLIQVRGRFDVLAEARIEHDTGLRRFIDLVASHVRVHEAGASDFVQELADRLSKAPNVAEPVVARRTVAPGEPPAPRKNAIFISYASEDVAMAERLAEALAARRLPVWFDKGTLRSGDDYEDRIRAAIREAGFFVPVVSRQALTSEARFFIWEWNQAIRVSDHHSRAFLVPCVVDDVPRDDERILPRIRELHMQPVVDDAGLRRFVDDVQDRYRVLMRGGEAAE